MWLLLKFLEDCTPFNDHIAENKNKHLFDNVSALRRTQEENNTYLNFREISSHHVPCWGLARFLSFSFCVTSMILLQNRVFPFAKMKCLSRERCSL